MKNTLLDQSVTASVGFYSVITTPHVLVVVVVVVVVIVGGSLHDVHQETHASRAKGPALIDFHRPKRAEHGAVAEVVVNGEITFLMQVRRLTCDLRNSSDQRAPDLPRHLDPNLVHSLV